MKYIICKKEDDNYYFTTDSNDVGLETLGSFLTDASCFDRYEVWAKNDNDSQTGRNDYVLIKKNNIIEVSLEPNVYGVANPITVTKQNFITILDQWKKLRKEQWNQIIITQDDNGTVHLEGKNE